MRYARSAAVVLTILTLLSTGTLAAERRQLTREPVADGVSRGVHRTPGGPLGTQGFSPGKANRLSALAPWIETSGYEYFRMRLHEARRDVEHGLAITLDACDTRAAQERALEILKFKLDVLWSMLDAMWLAYVEGRPPYHGAPSQAEDGGADPGGDR